MIERRKTKRRHVMYYSRVFDKKTGVVVGYIVDLSPEGMMLISEEVIQSNLPFRLRMDLPETISNKAYLDFEAKSVWCQRDVDPQFYDTGFSLVNVSDEGQVLIQRIIDEYGFRENQEDLRR